MSRNEFFAQWLGRQNLVHPTTLTQGWTAFQNQDADGDFLVYLANKGVIPRDQASTLWQRANQDFVAATQGAPGLAQPSSTHRVPTLSQSSSTHDAPPLTASSGIQAVPMTATHSSDGLLRNSHDSQVVVAAAPARPPTTLSANTDPGHIHSGEYSMSGELEVTAGGRFGDYEIISELSRGGMGVIYKARKIGSELPVALKVILGSGRESELRQRFTREAKVLANLSHANIVRIRDFGQVSGRPYLAMDFIVGQTLRQWTDEHWRLNDSHPDIDRICELFRKLAEVLDYCHKNGIVHRDLKPDNILIEEDSGEPFLLDFGVVKKLKNQTEGGSLDVDGSDLTRTGQVVGTPAYMGPEQLEGSSMASNIGPWTDSWGLAATLYYVLTQSPPFGHGKLTSIYKALVTRNPDGPKVQNDKVPDWMNDLVKSCLIRQRRKRLDLVEFGRWLEERENYQYDPPVNHWPATLTFLAVLFFAGSLALAYYFMTLDRSAPKILVLSRKSQIIRKAEDKVIRLKLADASPVCKVFIRSKQLNKEWEFQAKPGKEVALKPDFIEGVNDFTVSAQDNAENRSRGLNIQLYVDELKPEILVSESSELSESQSNLVFEDHYDLSFKVSEPATVTILNKSKDFSKTLQLSSEVDFKLPIYPGQNNVEVRLTDVNANSVSRSYLFERRHTISVGLDEAKKGVSNYKTLAEAIKAANDNDVILLAHKVYKINRGLEVEKSILLQPIDWAPLPGKIAAKNLRQLRERKFPVKIYFTCPQAFSIHKQACLEVRGLHLYQKLSERDLEAVQPTQVPSVVYVANGSTKLIHSRLETFNAPPNITPDLEKNRVGKLNEHFLVTSGSSDKARSEDITRVEAYKTEFLCAPEQSLSLRRDSVGDFHSCYFASSRCSAVRMKPAALAVFRNCSFEKAEAEGIEVLAGSRAWIRNCYFEGNQEQAVQVVGSDMVSYAEIENCEFVNNGSTVSSPKYYATIEVKHDGHLWISNSQIDCVRGLGIHVSDESSLNMKKTLISKADLAIGVYDKTSLYLQDVKLLGVKVGAFCTVDRDDVKEFLTAPNIRVQRDHLEKDWQRCSVRSNQLTVRLEPKADRMIGLEQKIFHKDLTSLLPPPETPIAIQQILERRYE